MVFISLVGAFGGGLGCGGQVRRQVVLDTTIALPAGRFAGPVEVELPRKADDPFVVYEIHTTLTAACAPRLRVVYPDGEAELIGRNHPRWQALLARRAQGAPASPSPASPAAGSAPGAHVSAGIEVIAEGASESAAVPEAPVETGEWRRITTDSWPGQVEYLALRESFCASSDSWTSRYDTALDENGLILVWADVPQDLLAGASLHIKVVEAIDVADRREYRAELASEARERERAQAQREREEETRRARGQQPRPPKPAPKPEYPGTPEAEGARWIDGEWLYAPGEGRWVWVGGRWAEPANAPVARAEDHGPAPVSGARWQSGHWVWVEGPGAWRWQDGHWLAPPPKVERPGTPPVPESPWIAGKWIRWEGSFKWISGYWGPPVPRLETIPAPPFAGAKWRAGIWLKLGGKWKWSPGYYESGVRKPPPRKTERPSKKPHPDAVWLVGFWRWHAAQNQYTWVPGHWEEPPGEGYVWVPDPPDPQTGTSITGRWRLDIDVDVDVDIDPDLGVDIDIGTKPEGQR